MYNRGHSNLEDPWVSIRDHYPKPNLMVYAEYSHPANVEILKTEGGMDVFIRKK